MTYRDGHVDKMKRKMTKQSGGGHVPCLKLLLILALLVYSLFVFVGEEQGVLSREVGAAALGDRLGVGVSRESALWPQ